jgi:hypothetical protein
MLYDKRWDKTEVKADPFSLESLIAWLEKQPTNVAYDWDDCDGGCLIGLYGNAIGIGERWKQFHSNLFESDRLYIASRAPHTFGAALDRARKVLAAS